MWRNRPERTMQAEKKNQLEYVSAILNRLQFAFTIP